MVFVSKAMGSYPARQASLLARRTADNECVLWLGEHQVVSNANGTAAFSLRILEFSLTCCWADRLQLILRDCSAEAIWSGSAGSTHGF